VWCWGKDDYAQTSATIEQPKDDRVVATPTRIAGIDDAVDVVADADMDPDQLLRLDRALTELAADEPRLAELVELRFFAGMPVADIAVLQGVSERTLNREWRRARAQLHASLYPDG
jgi:RNA polymerase sigma factor (sigma-70 family)